MFASVDLRIMLRTQTDPDNEASLTRAQLAPFIFNASSILNISKMATVFIKLLESWVGEAVACHGDDWSKIMAFVEKKLESLEGNQRAELSKQLELVLQSNQMPGSPATN